MAPPSIALSAVLRLRAHPASSLDGHTRAVLTGELHAFVDHCHSLLDGQPDHGARAILAKQLADDLAAAAACLRELADAEPATPEIAAQKQLNEMAIRTNNLRTDDRFTWIKLKDVLYSSAHIISISETGAVHLRLRRSGSSKRHFLRVGAGELVLGMQPKSRRTHVKV